MYFAFSISYLVSPKTKNAREGIETGLHTWRSRENVPPKTKNAREGIETEYHSGGSG